MSLYIVKKRFFSQTCRNIVQSILGKSFYYNVAYQTFIDKYLKVLGNESDSDHNIVAFSIVYYNISNQKTYWSKDKKINKIIDVINTKLSDLDRDDIYMNNVNLFRISESNRIEFLNNNCKYIEFSIFSNRLKSMFKNISIAS
jgi:hypothetical protein